MSSFGNLLRQFRMRAGLSQKELARRSGLNSSYLNRIERGRVDTPSREKIAALAAQLGLADARERSALFLVAGRANATDVSRDAPYGGADTLPDHEEIAVELRGLLLLAFTGNDYQETLALVRSFLDWLRFRAAEPERSQEGRETPGTSVEAARKHHAEHGDMDGRTCLLSACALHYPKE
jgi:transcriptional regulator with XRE-family HTH domain